MGIKEAQEYDHEKDQPLYSFLGWKMSNNGWEVDNQDPVHVLLWDFCVFY